MLKAFKEFAMRGNVVDLAVGVIIGTAFGKIVSSVVADLFMPTLGLILGKVDFSNLFIVLSSSGQKFNTLKEAQAAGVATLNYGNFIGQIVDFTIVAFALFLFVRAINRLNLSEVKKDPETKDCSYCFTTIRKEATRCPNCTSTLSS